MKRKNPNNHKRTTPGTKGKEHTAHAFTSYDTTIKETATPQKVRETRESAGEHNRLKKAKGKKPVN